MSTKNFLFNLKIDKVVVNWRKIAFNEVAYTAVVVNYGISLWKRSLDIFDTHRSTTKPVKPQRLLWSAILAADVEVGSNLLEEARWTRTLPTICCQFWQHIAGKVHPNSNPNLCFANLTWTQACSEHSLETSIKPSVSALVGRETALFLKPGDHDTLRHRMTPQS